MSQPEDDAITPLARLDDEPLFDEPWQAQALGLAFVLSERGMFSPAQWSRTLGAEHRKLLGEGSSDTPQTYYEAVVQAIEKLVQKNSQLSGELLEERVKSWRRAYQNTPHGQPVKLSAGKSGAQSEKTD